METIPDEYRMNSRVYFLNVSKCSQAQIYMDKRGNLAVSSFCYFVVVVVFYWQEHYNTLKTLLMSVLSQDITSMFYDLNRISLLTSIILF